jgi:hypothetical protein
MLQNTRDEQGANRKNSEIRRNEKRDRKNYEGFEGMNYEQSRKPYPRDNVENASSEHNGNSNRQDEY